MPLFVVRTSQMFQLPSGSAEVLAAMRNPPPPVKSPVFGSWSRYSALTNQRWVEASNWHDTSKEVGPKGPSGRTNSGGRPKNWASVMPTGSVPGKNGSPSSSAVPVGVYTWITELMISNTCVSSAHRPWSGGSPWNWLPLPE